MMINIEDKQDGKKWHYKKPCGEEYQKYSFPDAFYQVTL